jgi:hypothetical protein
LNGRAKRSGLNVEVVAGGVSMFGRRAAVLNVVTKRDGVGKERRGLGLGFRCPYFGSIDNYPNKSQIFGLCSRPRWSAMCPCRVGSDPNAHSSSVAAARP